MKAVLWTAYGGPEVLRLAEVPKPTPKADEVLIRVRATTVTSGDCELRRCAISDLGILWLPLRMYVGLLRPTRISTLGQELAGDIEAVGKDVTRVKVGDRVFAATGFRLSGNAEYVCLPEDGMLAVMPSNMTYAQAACIPFGGLEAWQYLRRAEIQPGQRVLVIGAGGSIGCMAVQLARHYGAEVTAVDSAVKLDMLRSIGADHVIDFTEEDFTENGLTYDVIFDAVGASSPSSCAQSLRRSGKYLTANPGTSDLIRGLFAFVTRRGQVVSQDTNRMTDGLVFLQELIEAGRIEAVVDRQYPLERTGEAHRYVETGVKQGNVVVTVEHAGGE